MRTDSDGNAGFTQNVEGWLCDEASAEHKHLAIGRKHDHVLVEFIVAARAGPHNKVGKRGATSEEGGGRRQGWYGCHVVNCMGGGRGYALRKLSIRDGWDGFTRTVGKPSCVEIDRHEADRISLLGWNGRSGFQACTEGVQQGRW